MKCVCGSEMRKTKIKYKAIEMDALQCPKCRKRYFTEELAKEAINKMEAKRLKQHYLKNPIRIGHSWGVVFPKELAEFFNFNNKDTKIVLKPNLKENKVEIKIQE